MRNFLGTLMGSILRVVYNIVSGIGTEPTHVSYYAIAVIITSIIFKLLLLPININQSKSSKKMNEIQPKLKEIQTKYKNDPQTMQVKMQQLYKDNNYNPASGCLVLLIQFPIILAFFAVFREPAKYAFTEPGFYEAMNKSFLWIANLENSDPYLWGMPLLAALTTYLQTKTMPTAQNVDPQTQATQKTMNYFLPVMIFISARSFAAGLALYWIISNLFTIVQQLITNRSLSKVKEEK
ncbi:YidC/Oxa1 family membrane protein insertase [Paratissierella segnis]|jgi:YidC/Oxa1 family membrane protein insertase|uniref:YidC/Oxa1 family membrane protein insertase n=1 Tax=Paratissierella segnis TaxID=2763679 RepID=A0A926ENF0_9FIRM|nr:YidC/Oxa1 family membrane protein insertase [Paratissierella segnis]MBC8586713.1 YidC/Oxa1 family membrane protein insertase [Paratissierella segnis]